MLKFDANKIIRESNKDAKRAERLEAEENYREQKVLESREKGRRDAQYEVEQIKERAQSPSEYKNAIEALKGKYIKKELLMWALDDEIIYRDGIAFSGMLGAVAGAFTDDVFFVIGGLALAIPAIGNIIAQQKGVFEERRAYYSGKLDILNELENTK